MSEIKCDICEGDGCVSVRIPRGFPFQETGAQRWISAALRCECEAGQQFAASVNPARLVPYMRAWAHRFGESHRLWVCEIPASTPAGVVERTEFDRMCKLVWAYPDQANRPRLSVGGEPYKLLRPRDIKT